MKKLNSLYSLIHKAALGLGLTALIFATSCTTSVEPVNGIDEESVIAELIAAADFDEVDDLSSTAMSSADGNSGGRVVEIEDHRFSCAEVTRDFENQMIIIDFGDSCVGPNGIVRSGKIIINYDGPRFIPGSTWVTSFEDFYIDGRHIEGVRTVTNITEELFTSPMYHIVLEGGKVTWPDETFATREVDKVRVWKRAENPMLDEFWILAQSTCSGVNREEVIFSSLVISDLIYKKECFAPGTGRYPVAGVKDVILNGITYTVDFGDGECDSIVTVTVDGVSETIDLSDRK